VVHCITALLLPGNRTETLDILRLEGSHREQINAAIRQASDGMLEALLKGASLTNPGPDRSQLNVQLKSEDLTRLRS
jgi:hypothetical protein